MEKKQEIGDDRESRGLDDDRESRGLTVPDRDADALQQRARVCRAKGQVSERLPRVAKRVCYLPVINI